MNIDHIKCVSLELAKKLKEAGYKQEGIWWWRHIKEINEDVVDMELKDTPHLCVAPTVAELGEALRHSEYKTRFPIVNFCGDWGFNIKHINPKDTKWANTEADARAKMWLYLKKEGLL